VNTTQDHPAIRSYLARLREVAMSLQPLRRDELIDEIRGHIDDSLASVGEAPDDTVIAGILARLGDPEDIVAAELAEWTPPTPPTSPPVAPDPVPRSGWGAIEVLALFFVTLGALFLPFVGGVIGIVLSLASKAWTQSVKVVAVVAAIVVTTLPALFLFAGYSNSEVSSDAGTEEAPATTIQLPSVDEPEPVLPDD
jgi:hypothetical protein